MVENNNTGSSSHSAGPRRLARNNTNNQNQNQNNNASGNAASSTTSTSAATAGGRPRAGGNPNNNNSHTALRLLALVTAILRWMVSPLRWLWNSPLFRGVSVQAMETEGLSPTVTAKATQQFVSYLSKLPHSSSSLAYFSETWSTVGFHAAKQEAIQKKALLFVYLHSPLHRDADRFCQKAFLPATASSHEDDDDTENEDPSVSLSAWLRQEHVVAVGVSIHTGQGAHLQQIFNVQAFPFCALLQPNASTTSSSSSNSNSLNLLLRAEGPTLMEWMEPSQSFSFASAASSRQRRPPRILPHLQHCLHRHLQVLAEQETRRLVREQEVELRRQQDEEYQAALRADQERERQQQAERQAQQEAERLQQEQERAAQQAEQAAYEKAKALVRDEPASGGAVIRFVLPSGAKINRRFHATDTFETLRAFLFLHFRDNHADDAITNIGLSTNFPRKTYNEESDKPRTLQEAGLVPQAVLMVQDLDA